MVRFSPSQAPERRSAVRRHRGSKLEGRFTPSFQFGPSPCPAVSDERLATMALADFPLPTQFGRWPFQALGGISPGKNILRPETNAPFTLSPCGSGHRLVVQARPGTGPSHGVSVRRLLGLP